MHHGPAVKTEKDAAFQVKEKIGLVLFGIYCAIYAGFVIINTVSPVTMEIPVFLGINLAVVYGFGLIILAIIMGLVYNYICTQAEKSLNIEKKAGPGNEGKPVVSDDEATVAETDSENGEKKDKGENK